MNRNGTDPSEAGKKRARIGEQANPSPENYRSSLPLSPGSSNGNLKQSDFFDDRHPFHDRHIVAYLAKISGELTDDQLRAFLRARYAYSVFQRLGTPESRRYAWSEIRVAILGQRGEPESAEMELA